MSFALIIVLILENILLVLVTIKLSRRKYDGTIEVMDTPEKKTFSMALNSDPDTLDQKKRVVFKVQAGSS
jgi:hypothetical protein